MSGIQNVLQLGHKNQFSALALVLPVSTVLSAVV